jgi:sugar-specific transcriptional regulator TrmB
MTRTVDTDNRCAKCGRELEELADTGRPKRYCGTPCRRAAEYELRRIQRQLEALEEQERHYRRECDPATARWGGQPEVMRAQHKWYVDEIARLEARLLDLFE